MKTFVLLQLIAVVALAGCSHRASPPVTSASPTGPPVVTSLVRQGSRAITVSGLGTMSGGANSQASLGFPQTGRIASVNVSIGQRVTAGSILARLDPGPFEAEVRQSEALLATAKASLVKVAAGSRPQQIAQTDAQISGARMQLSVADAKLLRQQKLFDLGIAAKTDVESAQAERATAAVTLRVLEQQQSAQSTPWAPDLAAARAGVALADAQVSASRGKLQASVLRAPFDGIVTARLHQDGESVDTASTIIGLTRSASAVFTAQFALADALRIHTGDGANVSLNGLDRAVRGRVIAINPVQTAEAGTVPVLVTLEPASIGTGPGAYGKATIQVGSQPGLYVPSGAVVADPTTGITQVFRKTADQLVPVHVKIAGEDSGRTWVSAAGLHAGDVIVAHGAYALVGSPAGAGQDADAK